MSTEKDNLDKRITAYELAEQAGLIGFMGGPKSEYKRLIVEITGKDKMADMTPEEADRFLEAVGKLVQAGQIQRVSWLEDPWSKVWTWIGVFVIITACVLVVDYFVGTRTGTYFRRTDAPRDGITWAPLATAILIFNMVIAAILRNIIKRHGRNSTAWTTAVIVFTPILAGLVYLLTWPRDKPGK